MATVLPAFTCPVPKPMMTYAVLFVRTLKGGGPPKASELDVAARLCTDIVKLLPPEFENDLESFEEPDLGQGL